MYISSKFVLQALKTPKIVTTYIHAITHEQFSIITVDGNYDELTGGKAEKKLKNFKSFPEVVRKEESQ